MLDRRAKKKPLELYDIFQVSTCLHAGTDYSTTRRKELGTKACEYSVISSLTSFRKKNKSTLQRLCVK